MPSNNTRLRLQITWHILLCLTTYSFFSTRHNNIHYPPATQLVLASYHLPSTRVFKYYYSVPIILSSTSQHLLFSLSVTPIIKRGEKQGPRHKSSHRAGCWLRSSCLHTVAMPIIIHSLFQTWLAITTLIPIV